MNNNHYFNITYNCDSNCIFCAANCGNRADNFKREVTPEEFEKALIIGNVKVGDKVTICGGEPTVSRHFWDIISICKRYECNINLMTNGHYFAEIENAKKLLNYRPIVVRIPLYGLCKTHDYVTGGEGNFNKAIQALDNFAKIKNYNDVINVKFLLCKATVNSNIDVFKYVYENYGDQFEYSVSPLIISNKVLERSNELLDTNTHLIELSKDFLGHKSINCDMLPLCMLSENKRKEYIRRIRKKYNVRYNDSDNCTVEDKAKKSSKCKICIYNEYCYKVEPTYLNYYGDSECHPFVVI